MDSGCCAETRAWHCVRLSSILKIRDAQQEIQAHEQELAQNWYASHPDIPSHLPAVWPASFVVRALRAELKRFEDAREAQSDFVEHWSWLSPGLSLVLASERRAGVDVRSHLAYMHQEIPSGNGGENS